MNKKASDRALRINSPVNPSYKSWLKLKQRRGRNKENAYLVESRKLIADLIASEHEVAYLICQEEDYDRLSKELYSALERFKDPLLKAKVESIKWSFLSKALFDDLSLMEQSDGLIGLVSGRLDTPLGVETASKRALLLDRLQDPGNVGTLLRSAEAFGFDSVIGLESVDFENPKVLRASMGSAFRLHLYVTDHEVLAAWVKEKKMEIIGADMDGKDYRSFAFAPSSCLVLGNEGGGISDDMERLISHKITIPMAGDVESLNVAISGSIIMSEMNKLQVG